VGPVPPGMAMAAKDLPSAGMRLLLRLVALLLVTTPCLGWGGDGHRIIGTIASSDLTPATAAAVRELLGDQTLADACCWADEIRSDHR